MGRLFSQSGDSVRPLSAVPFEKNHFERDLQRWADANPHLLNEGLPMLSLGREITTRHGHSIDNLFVDGNGCLVVAELKRDKTPSNMAAQVIHYAAHVSKLEWGDVEDICRKHRDCDLDAAFRQCFARPLVRSEKLDHRLLILAQRYDPSVVDSALYLINNGTPLALLQFAYFEVGGTNLFEVRTVLGEIPDQPTTGAAAEEQSTGTPEEGHAAWLFATVVERLPEIAERQGWSVKHKTNRQSLLLASEAWPTRIGDCRLQLDVWKKDALQLSVNVKTDAVPGLWELLGSRRDEWHDAFPGEFGNPPYPAVYSNLSYAVAMPEVGDSGAVRDVLGRMDAMARVMVPLLDEYFETREISEPDPQT